jgi:hypothetical protein
MQWITRERPKIDRIACPWLILRFIDAQAQFHYMPADRVVTMGNPQACMRFRWASPPQYPTITKCCAMGS